MYKIIQLCILKKKSPVKSVNFLGFTAIFIFLLSQKFIKKCLKNTNEFSRSHHKVSHFSLKIFFQPFFLKCSQQKGQETYSQSGFYPSFVNPFLIFMNLALKKIQSKSRNQSAKFNSFSEENCGDHQRNLHKNILFLYWKIFQMFFHNFQKKNLFLFLNKTMKKLIKLNILFKFKCLLNFMLKNE